jgi:glucose/arabinose dehydrogenase
MVTLLHFIIFGAGLLEIAQAVTCKLSPSYAAPVVANGWKAQLVAQGLRSPRSVLFDNKGNLLVVQQGLGIVHLVFNDGGSTCLEVSKKTTLITASSVIGLDQTLLNLLTLR